MVYVFKCKCGNFTEEIRRVSERNNPVTCSCGALMERIPCYHGGLKTEHPSWLQHPHVEGTLGRKFETRSEHDRYLQDNNIAQRG